VLFRGAPIAACGCHKTCRSIAEGRQQGVTCGGRRPRAGEDLVERAPLLNCHQCLDERHCMLGAVLLPSSAFGVAIARAASASPLATRYQVCQALAASGSPAGSPGTAASASLIHLAHVCERARCDQRAVADEMTFHRGLLRKSSHMFLHDREHLFPAPEVVQRGGQRPGYMHSLVSNGVAGESVAPPGKLQSGAEVSFDGDFHYRCGPEGVHELLPGASLGSRVARLCDGERRTVATCDPVEDPSAALAGVTRASRPLLSPTSSAVRTGGVCAAQGVEYDEVVDDALVAPRVDGDS